MYIKFICMNLLDFNCFVINTIILEFANLTCWVFVGIQSGNKQTDIRKWFMKSHDKGNGKESNPANPAPTNKSQPEELVGILTFLSCILTLLVELVKIGCVN